MSALNVRIYVALMIVVVVIGFYVPPTAKVIRRWDLCLKSHLKHLALMNSIFQYPLPILLVSLYLSHLFFFVIFIQFNVPFKIISLIEMSQSIGGAKREYPGKTT